MEPTTYPDQNQDNHDNGQSGNNHQRRHGRRRRSSGSQLWLDEFGRILDDDTPQDLEQLKARLREQLTTAHQALNEAADTTNSYVRGTVDCAVDCAEDYVETKPWSAIGYAAAGAFLLGIILGRR